MTTVEMLDLVRERMTHESADWLQNTDRTVLGSAMWTHMALPRLNRLQTLATLLTTQLHREERAA